MVYNGNLQIEYRLKSFMFMVTHFYMIILIKNGFKQNWLDFMPL